MLMRLLGYLYNYTYLIDWSISRHKPNYYKHLTNLYNWRYNSNLHQFTTAPSIARIYLRQNSNVLDICCGDGAISYLFFSDIAKKIDAIDISSDAIKYAIRTFSKENITFHNLNIFDFFNDYAGPKYNIIYFGSGFDYFSFDDRQKIYARIVNLLDEDGYFIMKTPIWDPLKYMYIQAEAK